MAVSARRVVVDDSAAVKLNSVSGPVNGRSIDVKNPAGSGVTIDLGGPDVTSGAGYELPPNAAKAFDLGGGDDLYAIAPAAQSVTVEVVELGI